MCTVSFLPRDESFLLLMNRDEKLSRPAALPPAFHRCCERLALFPYEISGGAWIGINDAGLTFALINWYSQPQLPSPISRGKVIPALLGARCVGDASEVLERLPLERMNPFRLMMFSARERHVSEWRSCGRNLGVRVLSWKRRHWFSSGLDEAKANVLRAKACRLAEKEADAETASWLRRLHRSHHPRQGAFSICMHRADAGSVSLTEVKVCETVAAMSYRDGPPCSGGSCFSEILSLRKSLSVV